jgi:ATP-dependent RNA helicase DDX49/DBP8
MNISRSSRLPLPTQETRLSSEPSLDSGHKESRWQGETSESDLEVSDTRPRKRQKPALHYPDASQPLSRVTAGGGESVRHPHNGNGLSTGIPKVISDPRVSFATLDIDPWLVASLGAMAITKPTAIQKGCIPKILEGRDCIGGSRTGSGKTVAFAVPILQKWAEDPIGIFAVILTPTRYVSDS